MKLLGGYTIWQHNVWGDSRNSRERVAYVMGILGNRSWSRRNGGDVLGLHPMVLFESDGAKSSTKQYHRRTESADETGSETPSSGSIVVCQRPG